MRMDTPLPDCREGPSASESFDREVRFLLSVPHTTIARRAKAYRKKVDSNPNRPGPKRKVKPAASPDPGV
jgi:hypothetical protein